MNENEWKRFISTYQLLIENTDRLIGQLLAAVKQKGIDDNTIILFTTDHGEMSGSHKLIAKTTYYEESSKIPIIIKYPKIESFIKYLVLVIAIFIKSEDNLNPILCKNLKHSKLS